MGSDQSISNMSPEDVNKLDDGELVQFNLQFTKEELKFMSIMTRLLYKMDMDGHGSTALKVDTLMEFIRYCITVTGAITRTQIFAHDAMITRLPDKESKKEFVAFREMYMGMPKAQQMEIFKKMGIVKSNNNGSKKKN